MKKSKFSEEQIAFAVRDGGRTAPGRCPSPGLRKRVSDSAVGFSVTVDSQKPVDYDVVAVGARVTVDAGDKVYFIDVHWTRGNIVDLYFSSGESRLHGYRNPLRQNPHHRVAVTRRPEDGL
jgi:hypothetical protein